MASSLPKDYVIGGVEILETNVLGEGAYGIVKLGKYYGLLCAVKKLKSSMFPAGMKKLDQQTELILQSFYNECEKLSLIRHPNVVQLLGVFTDKSTKLPVIVMEVMSESLSRLLYRTKSLPFHIEVNMCHDVSLALAYLHSAFKPPIVHRDLSSNNILLSSDLKAKITDLGVAKVANGSLIRWDDTPAPGTLVYMPPEVKKVPADLSSAMDVFALGVNMVQIRTHKFPKPGPEFSTGRLGICRKVSERDRRKDHLDLMGSTSPLRALAIDCLKDNSCDRPNALQVCYRLEKIKESKQYGESSSLEKMKNTKLEELKLNLTGLEDRVSELNEELGTKELEIAKLREQVEEERRITARALEESARSKLSYDILVETNKNGEGKKRKLFGKIKKQPLLSRASEGGASKGLQSDVSNEFTTLDTREASINSHSTPVTPSGENPTIVWYTHHCLPEGLHGCTLRALELGGKLYVCSGESKDGVPNKGLFYCSLKDFTRWKRATPDLPQYQCEPTVVQNELVLVGGLCAVDGKCTATVQSYDAHAQVWVERFPPMPTPRSCASVFVYAEYAFVTGGVSEQNQPLSTVEVLHIPSQTWETSARLPVEVAGHYMLVCGDKVYLAGGKNSDGFVQTVFVASIPRLVSFNTHSDIKSNLSDSSPLWSRIQDSPFCKMTFVTRGAQLIALGGEEVTQSANFEAAEWIWFFNSDSNTWKPVQGMPSARKLCCVNILQDGSIIVIGGYPDYCRIDIAQII